MKGMVPVLCLCFRCPLGERRALSTHGPLIESTRLSEDLGSTRVPRARTGSRDTSTPFVARFREPTPVRPLPHILLRHLRFRTPVCLFPFGIGREFSPKGHSVRPHLLCQCLRLRVPPSPLTSTPTPTSESDFTTESCSHSDPGAVRTEPNSANVHPKLPSFRVGWFKSVNRQPTNVGGPGSRHVNE